MKIYSPNKEYTGISASVSFCSGVGETDDPHLIEWFKEHGYETEKSVDTENDPEAMEEPLTEMEPSEPVKGRQSGKRG